MTQPASVEGPLIIAHDHPSFEGHFPGRPVLPGVVLLAEALAAIGAGTGMAPDHWMLRNCKFVLPVAPGTPLTLSYTADGAGIHFEVLGAAGVVASGALAPRGVRA